MDLFSIILGGLITAVIFGAIALFVTGHWIIAGIVIGVVILLGIGIFLWIISSYPG